MNKAAERNGTFQYEIGEYGVGESCSTANSNSRPSKMLQKQLGSKKANTKHSTNIAMAMAFCSASRYTEIEIQAAFK